MQYLLSQDEYETLKRKADAWDTHTKVPVPINAEGSGSDWKEWAKHLFPARIKVCQTADEVQAVLDANRDSLDALKGVSAAAYAGLQKLWTAQIDGLAGKEA